MEDTRTAQAPSDSLLDRATDPEYAAVSVTAVSGLILSALGAVAVVLSAAFLVVVPLAGLVTSAIALHQVRRAKGVLTGRWLAIGGMVLGAALALVSGGRSLLAWHQEKTTLQELRNGALEAVDALAAGDYEKLLARMPPEMRAHRENILAELHQRFDPLFADAGRLVDRKLLSVEIRQTESGEVVAPARVRADLERRILEVTTFWAKARRPAPGEPTWQMVGGFGEETFESTTKFGTPEERAQRAKAKMVPPDIEGPRPPAK